MFGCVCAERLAPCKQVSWPAGLVIISHGLDVGLKPGSYFFYMCVHSYRYLCEIQSKI